MAADAREARRNFRLGVANGGLYQGGEGFVDPTTVIPVVVSDLTRSNALIGLASALGDVGWMLPQVFIAPWASRLPDQMRLYRGAAVVRSICLFSLAASAFALRHHPAAVLGAFFGWYGVYSFGAGFGGVAFMEVVGRTVPAERLGSYFAQRMFWGGTLAALAGLAVRQILKIDDPGVRLGLLVSIAAVVCTTGYAMFANIREPRTEPMPIVQSPLGLLRQGAAWMRRDGVFRRLFVARGMLSVWQTSAPFMTLFAVDRLGGGPRAAGTMLMARVAGFVLSNVLWVRLSRTRGNRAILRVATGIVCVLLPAAALLAWASPWGVGALPATASVLAFEALAALGGAASSGLIVGYASAVIGMAPPGQRQSFVSLMNTFLGPTMLLPMVGGFIVDVASAPVLFVACGVVSIAGYRAAAGLPAASAKHAALVGHDQPPTDALVPGA